MPRPVALLLLLSILSAPYPVRAADPGPVVAVGGGKLPDAVRARFLALAGGEKARIVVVPTASGDADDPAKHDGFLAGWKKLNPASVELLHTRDRKRADAAEFVKPLADATAVWFSGGDQSRLTAAYAGTRTGETLKALHARGGAVGGTSAGAAVLSDLMITGGTDTPTLADGLGFLPGTVVDQHFVARKRHGRLAKALALKPGRVGLGVDESTAAVVVGRRVEVLGESTVTVLLAGGGGRSPLEQVLKAGEVADLTQLRRAAANRAANEPFPPAKPAVPAVPKGALVIVGGGGVPESISDRFFALAGGKDAPIVVVPTAAERDPIPAEPPDYRLLKRAGATNLILLHTRDRKQADDPAFSAPLLTAKGVWFGGGRQWRFLDSYEGTLTEKRFRQVLERGGVIGGTSAGASIQGEYMPRGHPLGNTVVSAEGYERGFGFLPGVAIDQHFFARKRTADMVALVKRYPQYLGVGIDEATAIVVKGSVAEVVGDSKAAFYDAAAGPDPVVLPAGGRYDLRARKAGADPAAGGGTSR